MVRELPSKSLCAVILAALAGQAGGAGPRTAILLKGAEVDTTAAKPLSRQSVAAASNTRFVLQLDGPMTPQRRATLEGAGVSLGRNIPPDAYIARIDRVDPAKIASLSFVRWNEPLVPQWKLDPELGVRDHSTPERMELDKAGLIPVVVTLFTDTTPQELSDTISSLQALPGAQVHRRFMIAGEPAISATVRFADLGVIAQSASVQWVEEAPEITERNSSVRWIAQSNIPLQTPLWNNGLTGIGQVVGVLDSRIDRNHCAFFDVNPIGPTHRKLLAFNTTQAVPGIHGTHVAGTLAGDSGDNSDNRGIAYGSKIVYNLTPSFIESDVYERLSLHHSQGARVHNNSWGNNATASYDGLARGIDDFVWRVEDDVVVFAITNGPPSSPLTNPENAKNCISVGCSGDTPDQELHCQGGSGPTLDGRRKPDVFAPGCATQSASANTPCSTINNQGTSMAAPVISGISTLIRQYFTDGYYPSGAPSGSGFTPSGALVKAALINSCVDMSGIAGYPSNSEGWGRVLADNTLYFPGDTAKLFVVDRRNAGGMATNDVDEFTIPVNSAAAPLRVTLVWTDPPAAAGALAASVNNLDLEVVAPDTITTYVGNSFSGGQSAILAPADDRNNVEQVLRTVPDIGSWKVRVKGTAVNESYQGYAIVVTGDIGVSPSPLVLKPLATPTLIAPGQPLNLDVQVTSLNDPLLNASPTLHYRVDGGAFQTTPMTPLPGSIYRGQLPGSGCNHQIDYYFSAQGTSSGTITAPTGAPAHFFTATTGTATSTPLLSADFESGLPAGWTTTGLWHISTGCVQAPACNGTNWAYFGNDAFCNYAGATRFSGLLTAPQIALPSVSPGQSLRLTFCSSLGRESFANVDFARVRVNGSVVLDLGAANTNWNTRTVNLTPYAGMNVTLDWFFDTVDTFDNTYLGWQVDNILVELLGATCVPPTCASDINHDTRVDGFDLSILLANFGATGANAGQGDINNDTNVNGGDLSVLLNEFGNTCN